MKTISKEHKTRIIGIKVRTSNTDNRALIDITALWERFVKEAIAAKIQEKRDDKVYCVYTNYESDFTGDYDTVLGCEVPEETPVPEGMVSCVIETGEYALYSIQGPLNNTAVIEQWQAIWAADYSRKYTTDFECYAADVTVANRQVVAIGIAV